MSRLALLTALVLVQLCALRPTPTSAFSIGNAIGEAITNAQSSLTSVMPEGLKPILVCTTAPSLEGMAFCRQVLERKKFRVRALTRNPSSPRAMKLREMGAEIVVADNNDVDSLTAAFAGAHGVYAITTWSGSTFDADGSVIRAANLDSGALESGEVAQGANILRAAESTVGLRHFVLQSMHRGGRIFGSIDSTNAPSTDVPSPFRSDVEAPLHHRAKWTQEDALLSSSAMTSPSSSCAWSILRQPTYLENFDNDDDAAKGTKLRLLRPGVVSGLLDKDIPLTVIAVEDLGALASRMFENKRTYASRVLIAGSERITGSRLALAAGRVNGNINFDYSPVPWPVLEYLIPVEYPKQLKKWLTFGGNDEGAAGVDFLSECRELHPEMMSLDDWLRKRGVDVMEKQMSPVDILREKMRELISS